jgi:hypothetical protein
MAGLSKILSALVLLALLAVVAVRLGFITEAQSPFSPLSLEASGQWFVSFKLAALRNDRGLCRAMLAPRVIDAEAVPDRTIQKGCGWSNAVAFTEIAGAQMNVRPLTCDMAAATALWMIHTVQPAARSAFGSDVARIQHFGTYSCRNIAGRDRRSQHARANAVDIAGFTLADGRTVSVRRDWDGDGAKSEFLRTVLSGADRYFRITLGPDYDAAHADHFHFDRGGLLGLGRG